MSGAAWLRRRLLDPPAPLVAIEVRPRAIGVVRLVAERGTRSLGAAASVELAEGTLAVSMAETNVRDAAAFRLGLRSVAEKAGILGAGTVALVLPDPVARVALVPAAEVKARRGSDAAELVRFRLRKAVPFEIRDAQLATVPLRSLGGEPQVMVGVVLRSILAEYEGACRELGLEPGVVVLSGLAILEAVEAGRAPADRLVVNWDHGYVSLLLLRNGVPVLIRTLSGPSAASSDLVAREAEQTVVYYRERLGGTGLAEAVLRSAVLPPEEAASLLEGPLGRRPEILDPWGSLQREDPLVSQSLAGAAAVLSSKAA